MPVLSLRTCRELLGPRCLLSDAELETLRDQLYALAELTLVALSPDNEGGGNADEEDTD